MFFPFLTANLFLITCCRESVGIFDKEGPGEHEAGEDALPGREGPAPVDQPGAADAQVALNDQDRGQV